MSISYLLILFSIGTIEKTRTEENSKGLPQSLTNSIGMEFVLVPKGKSWLGGGGGKPGEKEVVIRHDFYLGKYEVTQAEWRKSMGKNPSMFTTEGLSKRLVVGIPNEELMRFPVENVSWLDTQEFIKRLNAKEKGKSWKYRLPTVVEWEYACRGGPMTDKAESAFDFYFEKPTNQIMPEQANFEHDKCLNRTCKVGSYKPNRLGLYDMHGNVAEWCNNAEKADDGVLVRPFRGGYWASKHCRASTHEVELPKLGSRFVGLRLARVRADDK